MSRSPYRDTSGSSARLGRGHRNTLGRGGQSWQGLAGDAGEAMAIIETDGTVTYNGQTALFSDVQARSLDLRPVWEAWMSDLLLSATYDKPERLVGGVGVSKIQPKTKDPGYLPYLTLGRTKRKMKSSTKRPFAPDVKDSWLDAVADAVGTYLTTGVPR